MQIFIPTSHDFSLAICDQPEEDGAYPTARLKKGFLLFRSGLDLAEEAVGFGVPVLKRGLQTFFPGKVELTLLGREPTLQLRAVYTIDLVEKISKKGSGSIDNRLFYAVKNALAGVFRSVPPMRGILSTFSNLLRKGFAWQTTYEKASFSVQVPMTFSFDDHASTLEMTADFSGLPSDRAAEVIIMNEQGATAFDRYRDAFGTALLGREIGAWSEVSAGEACFESSDHHLAFTLRQVAGARLFRGRELTDSRLAWSGFGYSIPFAAGKFTCAVRIENLP